MTLVRSDIDQRYGFTQAIGPVSIAGATTWTSSAIDLSAKPGWKVGLWCSTGTYTNGSFTPALGESDTAGGIFTTVTPISGSLAALAAGATTTHASYVPSKSFLKVAVLSASSANGALISASVLAVPPTG